MSVYRPKKSPYFQFDFEIGGHRFHGTTKKTSRREAEQVADEARETAKVKVKAIRAERNGPLTLDTAAGRYWSECGRHRSNADDLERDIARLIKYFGGSSLMAEITDDDVAKLVAWRRGHHKWNRKAAPLLQPATVNRSTTEVLQRIFTRARKAWRQTFATEPNWGQHLLPEPVERIRELRADEDAALHEVIDPEYEVLRQFSLVSGLRMAESLLRWTQVDFAARIIIRPGKGNRPIRLPMTEAMRAILLTRSGHDAEFVFTYVARRVKGRRVKGRRYPITQSGLKTHWRRRKAKAGVIDYRWHDNRHTFATELLRTTGNLKLVQRGLNHAKIETTAKYAHVMDDELRAGMEAADKRRDEKSRNKPRTTKQGAA